MSNPVAPFPTWRRKKTWEVVEIAGALGSVVAGAIAGLAPPDAKALALAAVVACGAILAAARVASKLCEWRDARLKEEEIAGLKDALAGHTRQVLGTMVKALRTQYFGKPEGLQWMHDRVTLFRCVDSGAGGKCLVIYAREGAHKESNCRWPVDENDAKMCRGVAGQIWSRRSSGVFTAEGRWDGDAREVQAYCDSLFMTAEEGARLGRRSAAYAGAAVMVDDECWGVLLLESPDPSRVLKKGPRFDLVNHHADLIGQVLKGGLAR